MRFLRQMALVLLLHGFHLITVSVTQSPKLMQMIFNAGAYLSRVAGAVGSSDGFGIRTFRLRGPLFLDGAGSIAALLPWVLNFPKVIY